MLLGATILFATLLTCLHFQAEASEHVTLSTNRTLIIVDKTNNFKQSHSKFLNLLQDLNHNVEIKSADDSTLKLIRYGESIYDNIIMLCPQVEKFRGGVSAADILDFIDAGHNLLLAGDQATSAFIDGIASEVGFQFKKTASKREFPSSKLSELFFIVGDRSKYPSQSFSYSGTQLKMLRNELSFEILSNSAPIDDIRPSSPNKFIQNVLIGAMQARNNARVVVSGSVDFYSDKSFDASKQANTHLTRELLKWVLKEKSLLRYSQVQHKQLNINPTPSDDIAMQTNFQGYTIMDDLEYTIKIELFENGNWIPYNGDDVQFEFVRIDPFVRQTMTHQADGTFVARFKVPDVYGVYKMEVDYKKEGLTYLFSSTLVSVRPLRHNEYERFIYSAYPYYFSAFLMIAYLYIFSFVYLYQQKEKRNNK